MALEEFNPTIAKDIIRRLSMIHRPQFSSSYSDAVTEVEKFLKEYDIDYQIKKFPADRRTKFNNFPSSPLWVPKSGFLEIIDPDVSEIGLKSLLPNKRLASFREVPLSIIQRSIPTPSGSVECELVDIGRGYSDRDYEHIDVEGKVVLTSSNPDRIRKLAVHKYGAVGIVTDRRESFPLQEEPALSNYRLYSSFWWYDEDPSAFGFVITPFHGDRLRNYLKNNQIFVRAQIDAEFRDGEFEVVVAEIKGKTDQEVIVTSHLDHPKPSSVDNAAGVATSLELARTLKALIDNGSLNTPIRTIKFVFMNEFTGSSAYIRDRMNDGSLERIVGGINIDMVGNDQERTGGSFLVVLPSLANYSYIGPVASWLFSYLIGHEPDFAGSQDVADFKWQIVPFSGGSDYYIYNAPSIDVPMIGVTSWPYTYYHTDNDLPEMISEKMIKKYGVFASSLIYLLSDLDELSVPWLIDMIISEFGKKVDLISQNLLTTIVTSRGIRIGKGKKSLIQSQDWAYNRMILLRESYHEAILSIRRLVPDVSDNLIWDAFEEMNDSIKIEKERLERIFEQWDIPQSREEKHEDMANLIPIREVGVGPIDRSYFYSELSYEEEREIRRIVGDLSVTTLPVFTLIDFWIDGRNSAKKIADNVYAETGFNLDEVVYKLLGFLEKHNLIRFGKNEDTQSEKSH